MTVSLSETINDMQVQLEDLQDRIDIQEEIVSDLTDDVENLDHSAILDELEDDDSLFWKRIRNMIDDSK